MAKYIGKKGLALFSDLIKNWAANKDHTHDPADIKAVSLLNLPEIESTADLNTYISAGQWSCSISGNVATITNLPEDVETEFVLSVSVPFDNSDIAFQSVHCYATDGVYTRVYMAPSQTFTEWVKLLNSEDYVTGGGGAPILDIYDTYEELIQAHPTGNPTDAYLVGEDMYLWSETDSAWVNVGPIRGPQGKQGPIGPKGDKGDKGDTGAKGDTGPKGDIGEKGDTGEPGAAATITVGNVVTGDVGTNVSVVNSGTANAAVLDFTIPRGDKGEKGDTGETGAQGIQGIPGVAATINVGDVVTGAPGTSANVENVGDTTAAIFKFTIPRGDTGPQGPKGDKGDGLNLKGSVDDEGSLPSTGKDGEAYIVNGYFYVWDSAQGKFINTGNAAQGPKGDKGEQGEQGERGPQGIPGAAATIAVGEVTTGEPNSQASVVNSGNSTNAVFDFTIPKGAKGDKGDNGVDGQDGQDGAAATIALGSVSTGEAGTQVKITNSGNSTNAVFNFTIPKGDKGEKGDTGPQGEQGIQGPKGEKGEQGEQGPQGPSGAFNIDLVYPIGSIYLSMSDTNPNSLFGGTWQKILGRFLMTSDSSYVAGETGGSNDAIVVSHSHTGSAVSAGSHSHSGTSDTDGSHTHSISGGSHNHTGTAKSAGAHTHGYYWQMTMDSNMAKYIAAGNDFPHNKTMTDDTDSAGAHTHSLTINTSASHSHSMTSAGNHWHNLDIDNAGAHTHSVTVNSTGSSGTNKNMPEYIVVNAWQRTA